MSGINYSNSQIEWDQRALLEDLRKDIFLSLKVMDIATVVGVDLAKNTLEATINYKKTVLVRNEKTTGQPGKARPEYVPKQIDYPKLTDVPIFYLGSPQSGITTPVKVGDQCLIIYNDRSIDSWFQDKKQSTLSSNRLHSISDGVALVGINSSKDAIQWLSNGVKIYNGQTVVQLKEKITVKNASENLNAVLQDLVSQLKTLTTQIAAITVTSASPGNPTTVPINAAAITATGNQIQAIGTRIGNLLE